MTGSPLPRLFLLGQGALVALAVVGFGVGFPLIGAMVWAIGVSPSGEDPLEVLGVLGCAGPITAAIYAPACVLSLVAARKVRQQGSGALGWVLAASVATLLFCPVGFVPLVVFVLAPPPQGTGDG